MCHDYSSWMDQLDQTYLLITLVSQGSKMVILKRVYNYGQLKVQELFLPQ